MMDSTSINRLQRRKLWKRAGAAGQGRSSVGARFVKLGGLGLIAALCFLAPRLGPAGFPELTLRAAWAQDYALAGQHFSSGQDAFAQGKYEQAAKEFQAAFDITHDSSMLVNIGESWQRASDGKKALAGYRAYLLAQPQAPDRSEIEGRIQAIETAMAEATAAANPAAPGGTPTTAPSANPVGPTTSANPANPATAANPAAPASTPSGVEKPPTAAPVAGQAGPAPTVPPAVGPDSGLGKPNLPAPVEPGKTDAAAASKPTTPNTGLRTAAWVAVAVAVALATSGAIVGLGAQDRADELQRRTTVLIGNQPPVYDSGQADAYTSLQSEGKAYNQAGIALLCTAGAVAVTAGILFIVDYVRRPKTETKAKGSWALVPTLLPGLGGAQPAAGGLAGSGRF